MFDDPTLPPVHDFHEIDHVTSKELEKEALASERLRERHSHETDQASDTYSYIERPKKKGETKHINGQDY
jgi:hypothetical protein